MAHTQSVSPLPPMKIQWADGSPSCQPEPWTRRIIIMRLAVNSTYLLDDSMASKGLTTRLYHLYFSKPCFIPHGLCRYTSNGNPNYFCWCPRPSAWGNFRPCPKIAPIAPLWWHSKHPTQSSNSVSIEWCRNTVVVSFFTPYHARLVIFAPNIHFPLKCYIKGLTCLKLMQRSRFYKQAMLRQTFFKDMSIPLNSSCERLILELDCWKR